MSASARLGSRFFAAFALLAGLAACGAGQLSGDNGDPADSDAQLLLSADAGSADAHSADAHSADAHSADASVTADAAPPSFDVTAVTRASVLSIAEASVGYTYWWGHGSLGGTMAGTCTGSCPSCTHTGAHGADCSGFVGKAWLLPEAMPIVGKDLHPFSTYNFYNATTHWSNLARGSVLGGDAMVYNANGAGHIFLYEKDDPWGSMWTYEARGCSYGIVHNVRTAATTYKAIRRQGL